MTSPRSMAVFCGSSPGFNPIYQEQAQRLGRLMAEAHITLVFGAGNVGLMGATARSALEHGGRVIGVLPKALLHIEKPLGELTEYYETETMHERKAMMYARSDAICILPGGFGTLDEAFEVLTWRMIKIMDKPVVLVNINDYWTPFLYMVDKLVEEGFVYPKARNLFAIVTDVDDVLPTVRKLMDGHESIGTSTPTEAAD